MPPVLSALCAWIVSLLRSHASLRLENLALRHQLTVYQQTVARPRLRATDRLFWAWLSRLWPGWQSALAFVQPHAVITWQHQRFRDHWRRLSQQGKPGRPALAQAVQDLIRQMWRANPTWGSPRIVGELRKLGIEGSAYDLHNRAFWINMALLACILLLEVWPMTTLMHWRRRQARGQPLDTRAAPVIARISEVLPLLIVAMVFAATAMARGLGFSVAVVMHLSHRARRVRRLHHATREEAGSPQRRLAIPGEGLEKFANCFLKSASPFWASPCSPRLSGDRAQPHAPGQIQWRLTILWLGIDNLTVPLV